MSPRTSARGLALAALAALALPAAHAQNAERPAPETMQERHVERVQQRLDLTDQQAGLVEQALAAREPGALWAAAAALAPTLSDDQRARLTAPPERASEADRPARQRADRPGRAERPGRPDQAAPEGEARREGRERPDRRDQYEAMKEARNAALGLSAEQVAAFDQSEAQQREAMQARRAQRDAQSNAPRAERRPRTPLPEAVAQILDDEQEAIWLVHRALSPQFRGRPGHGGH